MSVDIPDLPVQDSHSWFDYASALDAAIRELQTTVAVLTPVSGFIATINGTITPDGSGNVTLGAADVSALSTGYSPQFTDLPLGFGLWVMKDPVTGFWPSGWNPDGSPIYSGGAINHSVRPHARAQPVIWLGIDPSPDTVDSGTGGMLRGYDQRAIPAS